MERDVARGYGEEKGDVKRKAREGGGRVQGRSPLLHGVDHMGHRSWQRCSRLSSMGGGRCLRGVR